MGTVTATISKGGKKLDPEFQVIFLDVQREINKIPVARISLVDGELSLQKFEAADSDFFEPGNEIEIKLRYEEESGGEAVVFKGIVHNQLVRATNRGYLLEVELKHKAYGLTAVRKNVVFPNKTDDEVIPKILESSGLKVSGTPGASYLHKQLVQYGATDWDFALSRLDANGCAVVPLDEEIQIKAVKDLEAASKTVTFTFGIDEIYDFEFEASASGQIPKVSGTAWDIKKQSLMPPKDSAPFNASFGNLKAADIAGKIKVEEEQLINATDADENEIKAWTDARIVKSRVSLFTGRIKVKGRADVLPGNTIEIEGLGDRFKGKVLVSGVRHIVDLDGWSTELQLGISAAWFTSQVPDATCAPASGLLPAIHGLQIGVIDKFEEDKDGNFLVKVKIPAFKQEKDGIVYARIASLYAGKERGAFFFPETGDEVIVGFFNDDPRKAVIIGSLYSSANGIPKEFKLDADNFDKGITLKNGAQLRFKDDKKSVIELKTPGKNSILIDDEQKGMVITDQNGNKIELNDSGITIKSAKDLIMESGGNVTISGKKVEVK